jgi:hypothetical protein
MSTHLFKASALPLRSRVGTHARAMLFLATWALVAGCGNYSNEDLAFMEALPQQEALRAEVPRQTMLTLDADEWYRTTKGLVAVFNGAVESALGLVAKIRNYFPTRRIPSGRIWGPYPAEKQPGWAWMMVMRQTADASGNAVFEYHLGFLREKTTDEGALLDVLSGTFNPSATTQGGHGTIHYDTTRARGMGIPLPDNDNLASLSGSYASDTWPKTIDLTWVPVTPKPPADPKNLGEPSQATYHFQAEQNGDGALTYGFDDVSNPDFLPGAAGVDQFKVVSRWRKIGAGRADIKVVAGDFAGVHLVHCWNDALQTAYQSDKALGGLDVGDIASCAYPEAPPDL